MPGLEILIAVATISSTVYARLPIPVAEGKIHLARAVTPPTVTPAPLPVVAGKIRLAQATTPALPRPTVGPSTPVTSTVTNCMMSCNGQVANCYTGCFIPPPPVTASAGRGGASPFGTVTLNATTNAACSSGCASTHLACQTNCALLSPSR